MQGNVIKAFRKRMKRHGYTEISIKQLHYGSNDLYLVTAKDPLSGVIIKVKKDVSQMPKLLRK